MLAVDDLKSIADLDGSNAIFIYGSARQGQALFAALGERRRRSFAGFVDSKRTGSCCGYPVLDPASFRAAYRPGDSIVIASTFVGEIAATLDSLGVARAYDSNAWLHRRDAESRAAAIVGGAPLRDGAPVAGPSAADLAAAARCCYRLDFAAAAQLLLTAIERAGPSVEICSMLAYVRLAQNRGAEAYDWAQAALELEPGRLKSLERAASIALSLRRYDEVLRISRLILERDPAAVSAVINYRDTLLRMGRGADVCAELERLGTGLAAVCDEVVAYYTALAHYDAPWSSCAPDALPQEFRLADRGRARFVLTVTAFREKFVADFLDTALPTLLAAGNLGEWADATDSLLVIFTDDAGREQIRCSADFARLTERLPCRFIVCPQTLTTYPATLRYVLHNTNNLIGLRIAQANAAGIVFLAPDLVVSTDFFRCLAERVAAGDELVFYSFLGVPRDAFRQRLQREVRAGAGVELDARTLGRLARQVGLSIENERYRDGGVMTTHPYRLCWPLADGGVLSRTFVAHPLLLTHAALADYHGEYFFSNDSDFFAYLDRGERPARVSVFAQSERAVAFELVNTNLAPPVQPTVPPLSGHDTIATYGLAWSPLHRRLFGELSITSSLAPTSLQAEIAESDAALRDIRARIDRHLERYGERHYVAGYRPSLHCGFPEFPIEL